MDKFIASLAMVSMVFLGCPSYAGTVESTGEPAANPFKGYDGTFVLLDLKTGQYFRLNEARAARRQSPCSTFKIFNSLVGLDTGVLSGKDHLMKWDGTKYERDVCNRDQTLQSAITNSVVWYFQRVARSVGPQRMQKYLDSVGYGNKDISGGIDRFWLGSSLTISPDEQVEFMKRLCQNDLPFKRSSMDLVKEMLTVKTTTRGTLHGKTGTAGEEKRDVMGWFVGYVDQPGGTYVFATNIGAKADANGRTARRITEAILTERGIL
jgi:bla regulator protein BlaR1